MKKALKKGIGLLLIVMLIATSVFLIPDTAKASDERWDWVGFVNYKGRDEQSICNSWADRNVKIKGVSYNEKTRTLTLNNVKTSKVLVIDWFAKTPVKVKLKGSNQLNGLVIGSDVVISGSKGSSLVLNVSKRKSNYYTSDVSSTIQIIEGGSLKVESGVNFAAYKGSNTVVALYGPYRTEYGLYNKVTLPAVKKKIQTNSGKTALTWKKSSYKDYDNKSHDYYVATNKTLVSGKEPQIKMVTIKFNANGGKVSKSSIKVPAGNNYWPMPTPTKKGYTFQGWYTAKDKGTKITASSTAKKSRTLYAHWKPKSYSIKYKLNGGKNNASNPKSYKINSSTITFKKPTKSIYTFKGWYLDSKFKTKITSLKKGSTGNKTLYAKWAINKYTVKFNKNSKNATGSMESVTMKCGTAKALPANKYKLQGKTFVGWNTKADGSGKTYANKASVNNLTTKNGKTVTLYAQWGGTYTVKYDKNNKNAINSMNHTVANIGSSWNLPDNKYQLGGYVFAGWNTKADGTGKSYSDGASVKDLSSKNGSIIVLYAQWKPDPGSQTRQQ